MSGRPTAKQVVRWAREVEVVAGRIGRHFARSEPRRRAVGYTRGLPSRPTSDLAARAAIIRQSLTEHPVRTTAEAVERIAELTGIRRGPTQTRAFPAGLGFKW
jgi:hypothetical protein